LENEIKELKERISALENQLNDLEEHLSDRVAEQFNANFEWALEHNTLLD